MTEQTNQSFLEFIKGKFRGHSIRNLLFVEMEGYLFWIFKNIPGGLGFVLRNMMLKLVAKSKVGFVAIQPEVNLVQMNRMKFGNNIAINSGSYINAVGGIEFGNFVLLGSNVTISSGRHPIEGTEPVFARQSELASIIIEDDVWIGAGAVIMPGVVVKKGSVIGANSTVTKNTEEYGVYVGSPARKIRSRI